MYCVECGKEYGGAAQYCPEDGYSLKSSVNFTALVDRAQHCRNCGHNVSGMDNYCSSCGTMTVTPLIKPVKDHQSSVKSDRRSVTTGGKSAFTNKEAWMENIKPAAVLAGAGFVFVLIISFVMKTFLERILLAAAESPEDAMFIEIINFSTVKILLFLHTILPSLSFDMPEAMQADLNFSLRAGLFILPLVLGFAFAITGYLFAKFSGITNHVAMLQTALTGGVLYGFMLSTIALFAGESGTFGGTNGQSMGMNISEISASLTYPLFTVLTLGFLLFAIFTYLGSLAALSSSKVSEQPPAELRVAHWGISVFGINYSVLTILGFFYVRNTSFTQSIIMEDPDSAGLINLLSMQFGSYFASIAHFGALNFQLNLPDFLYSLADPELSDLPVTGSLWLFATSGGPLFDEFFFTGFPFLLTLSFLIPIVIIGLFSFKFKPSITIDNKKFIVIFSLVYAFGASFAAYLGRMVIDGGSGALGMEAGGSFIIASPLIQTFIGAFTISTIALFITTRFIIDSRVKNESFVD